MREVEIGRGRIVLIQGDITKARVDAIVTAANSGLRGGGGVDGAIHRAAGPGLIEACRKLGGCPTGSAAMTPAFQLEAQGVRHVIHAVGPMWSGGEAGEDVLLRGAYARSMELAERAGLTSIAFPSISTGVYGFPIERAAPIAIEVARQRLQQAPPDAHLQRIEFVLFDAATLTAFEQALG